MSRMALAMEPKSHYETLNSEQKASIRPFDFFQLPRELRDEIYQYLMNLHSRENGVPEPLGCTHVLYWGRTLLAAAPSTAEVMLQTCSQVYQELLHIWHSKCIFRVIVNSAIPAVRLDIGDGLFRRMRMEGMKHVQLEIQLNYPDEDVHLPGDWYWLSQMNGLETLSVVVLDLTNLRIRTPCRRALNAPLRLDLTEDSYVLSGLLAKIVPYLPLSVELTFHELPFTGPHWLRTVPVTTLEAIQEQVEALRGTMVEIEGQEEIEEEVCYYTEV